MALEHVSTILKDAREKNYAVMCFECVNYEQAAWCVEAAEEAGIPVILMLYYDMTFYTPADVFLPMAKVLAQKAGVPVGLTYVYADQTELVKEALEAGFPSVCLNFPGTTLEEKIDAVKQAVAVAKEYGADVAASPGEYREITAKEAIRFARETGIDALVAPVVYGHPDNNLNFTETRHWYDTNVDLIDTALLQEIHEKLELPLIIHRANNLSAEEMKKAMALGAVKFDNGCPLDTRFYCAAQKVLETCDCGESYFALLMNMKDDIKAYVTDCICRLYPKR